MKWQIPAKTFLLGEYAALLGASSLIVTTTPCFKLSLTNKPELIGIHKDSPAGRFWQQLNSAQGLHFHDPYQGRGGLGASSAEFLGAYWAYCTRNNTTPSLIELQTLYAQFTHTAKGLKPSGYDVLAQSQQGCVFINKKEHTLVSYAWPFLDLSFILLHTGTKIATHHHLEDATLPDAIDSFSHTVDNARLAFEQKNSSQFIDAINTYHRQLHTQNLLAPSTIIAINQLRTNYPEILALKGCGALGADILLLITSQSHVNGLKEKLLSNNMLIVATDKDIYLKSQKNT
jgi:mevalonate kinase